MIFIGIVVPFPLRAKCATVKLVGRLRSLGRVVPLVVWNRAFCHRLASSDAWIGFADYGPVIFPPDRLKVHDSSVSTALLEVNEPSLAALRFYISSLVRSVDFRRALRQHNPVVIGAVNGFRTKHRL